VSAERTPEYRTYHQRVVEACVALMGEENRDFFDDECDYFDEFHAGTLPEDVAREQWESIR
jgi:hypothetical protein